MTGREPRRVRRTLGRRRTDTPPRNAFRDLWHLLRHGTYPEEREP